MLGYVSLSLLQICPHFKVGPLLKIYVLTSISGTEIEQQFIKIIETHKFGTTNKATNQQYFLNKVF